MAHAPLPPTVSPLRFGTGIAFLGVAAAASGTLVASHLGGVGVPGCGAAGGCADASKSVLGTVPGIGLPTASLGVAYFAAVLAGYLGTRGSPGSTARWIARLGALASVGFLVGSVVLKVLCVYCIVSHAANLAFLVVLETTARTASRRSAGFWPALATFLVVGGGLGLAEAGVRSRAREKAEQELRDSTQDAIKQSIRNESAGQVDRDEKAAGGEGPDGAVTGPVTGAQGAGTAPKGPAPDVTTEGAGATPAANEVSPAVTAETTTASPGFTGRYRLGPEVAPVRVVIFSDYQCPECKVMERQVMDVVAKHPNVSVSAKHFPFCTDCNKYMPPGNNKHPNACRAARAAEAAGKVGGGEAFWAMHAWNFEVNGVFTESELDARVASMGLDVAAFKAAYNDPAINALVESDVEEGMALGLRFTPTVFVNGVELRGIMATDALLRAVEAILASDPTPVSASADRPPDLMQKVVDDWRAEPLQREPTDQRSWSVGPEGAALHLMMWGDYSEPFTARADAVVRGLVSSRTDLRYTFRHYPVDKTCNMFARQTMHPFSCVASRAAEAAGQLGGSEGYWKMHEWLLANQRQPGGAPPGGQPLTEPLVLAQAKAMGFDEAAFLAAYRGPEAKKAIEEDARGGARVNVQSLPTIVLNGQRVPRWFVGESIVLDRIIDAAAKDVAAKAPPTPASGG